jgi:hypothetical protein
MASIKDSELAQITARAGLARAGTARAGVAPKIYEMKDDATGEIIWNRPLPQDGDPDDTASTWVTGRE